MSDIRLIRFFFVLVSVLSLSGSLSWAQTSSTTEAIDNPFEADSAPLTGQPILVQPVGGEIAPSSPDIERRPGISESEETITGEFVSPFGSQLFSKANFIDQSLGVNAKYTIAPGDRIAVKMWGARTYENVLAVDVQGNIFIPEVGPVHVEGVNNSSLSSVVSASISKVFTNNVSIYTNLLGAQPIGIYVTGAVKFPGHFPGARSDSLLYFLSRAGGVDPERGSYRNIIVRRKGKTVSNIDLYDFLIKGDLPDIEFKDNDTIVVATQLPTVAVIGDVKNSYKYEIDPSRTVGSDVLALASPRGTASHVMLKGVRGEKAVSQFISLSQARGTKLAAGDILSVVSDYTSDQITIRIDGNSNGASTLAIDRSTLLGQVANLIEVDPLTRDLNAIYLRRVSVAERQKTAIERSLYELQRSVLTGSSSSSTGSAIRVQEAQLINKFVMQARSVAPEGRVVLAGVDWSKVHLEEGDEIVIPEKSEIIFISGEVKVPQTILWRKQFGTYNYIQAAGGLSNRGDEDRLVILRRNGSVHDGSEPIQKGDHIMVLPALDTKIFAMFKDLVEITYRIALSTAVVLRID